MRVCPFCNAENTTAVAICQGCGRRLPPLPPRGMMLGARPTVPPQNPPAHRATTLPPPMSTPSPMVGVPASPPDPRESLADPDVDAAEDHRRQLAHALDPPQHSLDGSADNPGGAGVIDPGPAAQRREVAPEPSIIGDRRRRMQGGQRAAESSLLPAVPPTVPAQPPDGLHAVDPFIPPDVLPIPHVPEPGLVLPAKYAYVFARGWWQRRGAIRQLGTEIRQNTEALDQVLGALGRAAREVGIIGRVFLGENSAIDNAEQRIRQFTGKHRDVESRKAEERSKFEDIERERNAKLRAAERVAEEASRELATLESQRRSLRERRKDIDRRLKANLKAANDTDRQAAGAPTEQKRQDVHNAGDGHRQESTQLESERQEIDRELAALYRPIVEFGARLDASKAELDAAKRSLHDAREGHSHRLAELNSEQKRNARDIAVAESEIARRLVTLGTLVNLNRIEDAKFGDLYRHIDQLRDAITQRAAAVERLTAERESYDRETLVRGVATIGGVLLAIIALVVIVLAIL